MSFIDNQSKPLSISSSFESKFICELNRKKLLHQCTNLELIDQLTKNNKKIVAYIGFDCTARSLHIGNLIQIMILRLLQKLGHRPIVLIGGGTSMIGDPTGKNKMRKVLSEDEIETNIQGIKKSLSKFIKFESESSNNFSDAILVNNNDWLKNIGYIEFLRNFGSKISVNQMLTKDVIKNRLHNNQHLSLLEFNYMLLQGYDFHHLYQNYNCVLQIGGSDQWTNIISGVDMVGSDKIVGLTTKLLTTSTGEKMGKTVDGAVWLNEDMCSPYEYFQYWRNIADEDVIRFAEMYSEMNDEELKALKEFTDINYAKKTLALHLTEMCHGKIEAQLALDKSINLFENKNNDLSLFDNYKIDSLPVVLSDILVQYGHCKSKKQAKDLIIGGAIMLDDVKILDVSYMITASNFTNKSKLKLTIGKKKHLILRCT